MSRGGFTAMKDQAAIMQSEPDSSRTPISSDQRWWSTVQQMSEKRLRLPQNLVRAMPELTAMEIGSNSKPIKLELVLLPPGVKDLAARPAVDVIRLASTIRNCKSKGCLIAGGELSDSKPCREPCWFTLGIRQLGPWHLQIMCSPKLPPELAEEKAARLAKTRQTREQNSVQQQQQQPDAVPSCSTTSLKRPRTAAGTASKAVVQRALRSKQARTTSTTAAVEASVKALQRGSVCQTDGAAATAEHDEQKRVLTFDLDEEQEQQQQHFVPPAAGSDPQGNSGTTAALQKMPLGSPADDVSLFPGSRHSCHNQQPQQQQHGSATVVDLTAEAAEGEAETARVPPRRTAPVSRAEGGVSSQRQQPPIVCRPLSGCKRQSASTDAPIPAAKRGRPTFGTRSQPRTPTAATADARQAPAAATPKVVVAKAVALKQMAAKRPRQQSATQGVSSAPVATACAGAEPEEARHSKSPAAAVAAAVTPGVATDASSDADDDVPLLVRRQRLLQALLSQEEAAAQSQAPKLADEEADHPKGAAVGAAAAAATTAATAAAPPLPAAPATAAKAGLVSGSNSEPAPNPEQQTLSAGAAADASLGGNVATVNCGDPPQGTVPGTAKGEAVAAAIGPPPDAAVAAAATTVGGNERQSSTIVSPSSGAGEPVQHTTNGSTAGDAPVRDSRQDTVKRSRSARRHHRSRSGSWSKHPSRSRHRSPDRHRHRHSNGPRSKPESAARARSRPAGVDGDDSKHRHESRRTSRSGSAARDSVRVRGGASESQARDRGRQGWDDRQEQQQQ